MSARSLNFGAASFLSSAYETAKELTYGERAFALTGANEFNGIRWFNKEKMDLTLWYLLAAVSMYSPRIMRNNIFKLYKTLCTARDGAEYQCGKFTDAIRPAKKAAKAKAPAKKPAVKKETATPAKKVADKKTK